MKFTSEDLMKVMGLQVGDTIKLNGKIHTFTTKKDGTLICKNVLKQLIDQEFEILPRPKRVGDLKCREYGKQNCNDCPIRTICVDDCIDDTLYNKLELAHKYAKDQEIYDLLKARLDKEVLDNA